MAEEKAAAAEVSAPSGGSGQKPILLIALAVINMLVVAGVGFMLYQGRKKEAAEPKIEQVIKGEAEAQHKEATEEKEVVGKVVPLETFIVNLAGSKGRKVAKVNMELEVKGDHVLDEIEKRKAQIRDIIIIILSSKTYEDVASREGKDGLRNEIKDTINSFLVQGKISNVFFTEFIYN
ncbi:MAG: flagellar protein FliL [Bdellovibrio sp. ArHS]|uniref:flagellar basal body-associated FliL family protein n=1 Tax=Bdellovibrio sp. ArHS TaxID=1569284 RepID=UPI000583C010|nr:flagellar basal body-associated FliL family protein [Bdellovibrio sp. ArHS]KHD89122.1 MAG: flagellar protein FliL [Bdellovibrio sp. ArHS]